MCGLRTRPRTDVDPLRVELPSAGGGNGAYRLAAPGAIPCVVSNSSLLYSHSRPLHAAGTELLFARATAVGPVTYL